MTHRRKSFIVYHPRHMQVGAPGYRVFASKRQAWKQAYKWGVNTCVAEDIHVHPAPFKPWMSAQGGKDWWIELNPDHN
jgi:hypothetical protein